MESSWIFFIATLSHNDSLFCYALILVFTHCHFHFHRKKHPSSIRPHRSPNPFLLSSFYMTVTCTVSFYFAHLLIHTRDNMSNSDQMGKCEALHCIDSCAQSSNDFVRLRSLGVQVSVLANKRLMWSNNSQSLRYSKCKKPMGFSGSWNSQFALSGRYSHGTTFYRNAT